YRQFTPRFAEGAFEANIRLVERFADIASAKKCTPAQLALAWLLAKGADIVPIPGTKSRTRLEENVGAADVTLTPEDVAHIEAALPPGVAEGGRYPGRLAPVWEEQRGCGVTRWRGGVGHAGRDECGSTWRRALPRYRQPGQRRRRRGSLPLPTHERCRG